MLRFSQLLIAALTSITAFGLQAECAYPDDVAIPDGAQSTYEQMRDSQAFVKEYMAEMETYLVCIEQPEVTDATESIGDNESGRTQRRLAAIDAMESVAAQFNEQVRVFKQTNP